LSALIPLLKSDDQRYYNTCGNTAAIPNSNPWDPLFIKTTNLILAQNSLKQKAEISAEAQFNRDELELPGHLSGFFAYNAGIRATTYCGSRGGT